MDFCCNEKKIIIELDGSQHKELEHMAADKERGMELRKRGYTVLRFNNNDLDRNIEGVLETIRLSI